MSNMQPEQRELLKTLEEVFDKYGDSVSLGRAVVNASPACNCAEVSKHRDEDLNASLRYIYLVGEEESDGDS